MDNKKFSVTHAIRFGLVTVINNLLLFLGLDFFILMMHIAATIAFICMFYVAGSTEIASLCKAATQPPYFGYHPFMNITYIFGCLFNNDQENLKLLLGKSSLLGIFIVCTALLMLLYRYFILGMVQIGLDFYDHHTSSFARLFCTPQIAFKAFCAAFLYHILVCLGTALFIIPGIIAAIRFGFFQQVLLDTNCGIIDALKKSWHITKGSALNIFSVNFLFGFLNFTSLFTFGLIYMLTFPALYLTQAYIYRKITQNSSAPKVYV